MHFSDWVDARSEMLSEIRVCRCDFSRSSAAKEILATALYIRQQHFRSDANCEEIFLFPQWPDKKNTWGT